MLGQAIQSTGTEAYTAVLSGVLDLPLSRSERKPVDKSQLSQQDLELNICLLQTNANKWDSLIKAGI